MSSSSNGFVLAVQALEPLLVKLAALGAIVALLFRFDGASVDAVIIGLAAVVVGQNIQTGLTGYAQAKFSGPSAQTAQAAQVTAAAAQAAQAAAQVTQATTAGIAGQPPAAGA